MTPQNEKPKLYDLRELYKTRVIVFLETEPLSNKYRRVVFNQTQFQLFVRFLTSMFATKGPATPGQPTSVDIKICKDEGFISLPENVSDYE